MGEVTVGVAVELSTSSDRARVGAVVGREVGLLDEAIVGVAVELSTSSGGARLGTAVG